MFLSLSVRSWGHELQSVRDRMDHFMFLFFFVMRQVDLQRQHTLTFCHLQTVFSFFLYCCLLTHCVFPFILPSLKSLPIFFFLHINDRNQNTLNITPPCFLLGLYLGPLEASDLATQSPCLLISLQHHGATVSTS